MAERPLRMPLEYVQGLEIVLEVLELPIRQLGTIGSVTLDRMSLEESHVMLESCPSSADLSVPSVQKWENVPRT